MLYCSDMDSDLVVLVESSSPHLPNLVLEKEEGGEGSTVALLSFVPNFRYVMSSSKQLLMSLSSTA